MEKVYFISGPGILKCINIQGQTVQQYKTGRLCESNIFSVNSGDKNVIYNVYI